LVRRPQFGLLYQPLMMMMMMMMMMMVVVVVIVEHSVE
jgi:hypothetical protein